MPTYEYCCDSCHHNFEEFQSMMEKPLQKCPKCGKKKLRRLFGCGAAILFKGSGFYETDHRSESYKSAAKADQEKAKTTEGGKSDSSAASDSAGKVSKSEKSPAKAAEKSQKSGQ